MNDDNPPRTGGVSAISAVPRRIHPLVAMAAVSVIAVSAIAAYQFLWPQSARSETAQESAHGSPRDSAHHATSTAEPMASAAQAPARVCQECGEVIAIRTSRKEGEGTGVGAVAGGVLGGVLGHQVGAGRGKEAMTVLGAVGGVFAGHEAEKQLKAQTQYLVDLRMADGTQRTVAQTAPPNFAVGASVRVSGNTIVPN
jgi:outer membrane lipoprotein SlyB